MILIKTVRIQIVNSFYARLTSGNKHKKQYLHI